jgi:hypothetical protein
MWTPGWIPPLISSNDDDDNRSRDEDNRKPDRPGTAGGPNSSAPSEEDQAAFDRLMRSDPQRQDKPVQPESEAKKENPIDEEVDQEADEPESTPKDRDERNRSRPSRRRPSLSPEGRPESGVAPGPGEGQGSRVHDQGGHDHQGGHDDQHGRSDQEVTPGMTILGTLQGAQEPAFKPGAASEGGDRLEPLLREVASAVWATDPTAHGHAAVHLQIAEQMLPKTTIDLAMKDDTLLVTIKTGTPEVEQFLADHLGELRDRLSSRLRGRSVKVELARSGESEAASAESPERGGPASAVRGRGR